MCVYVHTQTYIHMSPCLMNILSSQHVFRPKITLGGETIFENGQFRLDTEKERRLSRYLKFAEANCCWEKNHGALF